MTDNFDPDTGEVLEPKGNEPGGYALDGKPIPAAAATGGDIINMLEEGQFGADVHQAMADLMRIASGMAVHENSTVGDVVRLSSGEGSVTFTVQHETTDAAGEKMTVPPAFGVAVPVFRGEPPFCVIARLRYRKVSGSLKLWYELFRADLTFDTAVNEAIEKVQHETGLTVWKGQPEA